MRNLLYAIILIANASFAQSAGEQLLKKSAANIKALTSLAYNIYAEQFGEKINADVAITRKSAFPIFEISQVKLSGIAMTDEGSRQVSFASDGSTLEYFDLKSNSISRMDSPSIKKMSRTGLMQYMLLALPVYTQENPFEHIFSSLKGVEQQGDSTIYNVPCYKLKVITERDDKVAGLVRSEVYWFLGKDDLLVRGISSKYSQQFVKIKSINQQFGDAYFRLSASGEVKKVTGLEPISDGLLPVGNKAPDWSLASPTMNKITLSKLKGKVVLLDFWGTWCVPCIKAMPDIQAIHDQFKNKNVTVIGVSVETESAADPAAFVKRKGFTYPIVLDGKTITKDYKVVQFPSIYIIGKDGTIVHAEHGGNRENFKEDIIRIINAELNK
jgi:peroxiredoxin